MFDKFLEFLQSEQLWWSVVLLVVGVLFYFLIRRTVQKIILKRPKADSRFNQKRNSYGRLLRSLTKYAIGAVVVILILQVNGVDISSMLAGLGIASVIAGLALQDTLKNIIAGFNLVADDYFAVDDVLKIDGHEGKVIDLRLKTTKLKDIRTGDIYVLSNQDIREALIASPLLHINVPLPYEEKLERIEKVMGKIVDEIKEVKNVAGVEYLGVSEFADSAIIYKLRIKAKPELHPVIERAANRIIKARLDSENISIPYQQVVVWKGEK